jgi:glycosyltransferase involved in cell wall biosynthesis
MKIAAINQDPGIAPGRAKGAAVHVAAMRHAFKGLGHEVHGYDEPVPELLGARLDAEAHSRPFDLVYERYALGATAGLDFARARGALHVLEINAPLIDEARAYRNLDGVPEAILGEAYLFENTDLIVAVSDGVARYCRKRSHGHAPITVQPNGIDDERFHLGLRAGARERAGIPASRFVLGFHGRLRPWHNFAGLARAAMALVAAGVDVHLFCLGRGDFTGEVAEATDGLFPSERLTTKSWLPYEEVGATIAACDCLPLSYARGGPDYFSPIKLREAMAVGVVPVVPRFSDLERVVTHRESGLFYDLGDEPGLVLELQRLASDPAGWARLSRAAASCAKHHTWEHIAEAVLAELASSPLPATREAHARVARDLDGEPGA